jgi:hypothetical protein
MGYRTPTKCAHDCGKLEGASSAKTISWVSQIFPDILPGRKAVWDTHELVGEI